MDEIHKLISKVSDIKMAAALKVIIDNLLMCPLKKIDFIHGSAIGAIYIIYTSGNLEESDFYYLQDCVTNIVKNRIKHRI